MKNKRKKKIIIISISILIIVLVSIFIFFKNNNKLSKLKAEIGVGLGSQAHESFSDPFFYSCVINSYNRENNTNYTYKDRLSNEQLSTIKNLICYPLEENDYNNYDTEDMTINYIDSIDATTNIQNKINNTKKIADSLKNGYSSVYFIDGIELLTNIEKIQLYFNDGPRTSLFYNSEVTGYQMPDTLKQLKISFHDYLHGPYVFKGGENLEELFIDSKWRETEIVFEDDLPSLKNLFFTYGSEYDIRLNYDSLINLQNIYMPYVDKFAIFKNSNKLKSIYTEEFSDNLEGLNIFDNVEYIYLQSHGSTGTTLPKSLPNLKVLYAGNVRFNNDMLPDMPKIETLKIRTYEDGLDLSKYKNTLKNLSIWLNIKSGEVVSSAETLSLDKLENLEYLNIENGDISLQGFEKLKNLKGLVAEGIEEPSNIDNVVYGIEKLKCNRCGSGINGKYTPNIDYKKFPNLKVLITKVKDTSEFNKVLNDLASNNNTLDLLSINNSNKINYDDSLNWPDNLSVKNLDVYSIPTEVLNKIRSIENLEVDYLTSDKTFDFSNFPNLKSLDLSSGYYESTYIKNLDKAKNLEYMYIDWLGYNGNQSSYNIDFSNLSKLKYLEISDKMHNEFYFSFNLNNCTDLEYVILDEAYDLDLSNLTNIKVLAVDTIHNSLDISNSKDAIVVVHELNIFDGNIVNNKLDFSNKFKLPSSYKLSSYEIEDETMFDLKEDGFYSVKEGQTQAIFMYTYNYNALHDLLADINYTEEIPKVNVNSNIIVFDIVSNKIKINNKNGYIFTNPLIKEKDIIEDIKTSLNLPELNFYIVVDKNKLKLYIKGLLIKEYDLLKVTSRKYKIDEENIYYNGSFDSSLVSVTNDASVSLNGNTLDIIYDGKVVKTYNLIKKENILGDVNGDGKISITDMVMQYKHVKYVLDLEGDEEYRADLNGDEDVSIADSSSLYKILKKESE